MNLFKPFCGEDDSVSTGNKRRTSGKRLYAAGIQLQSLLIECFRVQRKALKEGNSLV